MLGCQSYVFSHANLIITENPLAGIFPARPLIRDSGSSYNLDIVATWVARCTEGHKNEAWDCSKTSTILPTRVLDVGITGGIIRLVNGDQHQGKYATLSYRVGSVSNSSAFILYYVQLILGFNGLVGKLYPLHHVP